MLDPIHLSENVKKILRKTKLRQPNGQKKSGIMKSGVDAMPLFLLDLLRSTIDYFLRTN